MEHILQWRVAADDHLVEGCLSCASLARLVVKLVVKPWKIRSSTLTYSTYQRLAYKVSERNVVTGWLSGKTERELNEDTV